MESPKNHEIHKLSFSQRFLFLVLHLTIIPYIEILFIFQYLNKEEIVYVSVIPRDIFMFTFLFILLSGILQVVVYKLWIPFMKKKTTIGDAFIAGINIIIYGGECPSVFGLIIGIIGYQNYDYVFFPISLPFILVGFGIKTALYWFIVKPYLDIFQR